VNYILKAETSLLYETNFACDNGLFLKFGSESFFITDGRYTIEAKESLSSEVCLIESSNLIKSARELIRKNQIRSLVIDPKEWSYLDYISLTKNIPTVFKKIDNFSKKRRIIKTPKEIEFIKESAKLNREGFDKVLSMVLSNISKSEKELQYLAKDILSYHGNLDLSFETIFAINENSAKAHAKPSSKITNSSDLLLLDGGVKFANYCSDRTRVVELNINSNFTKEQKFKNVKHQKIYDSVLKAQELAISSIKVGMRASEIDKIARDSITKDGFGEFFTHSTGHGVGLDIHELPIISKKSDEIIKDGMVFTIEPGIYLASEFGVRIEDMVLIENGKATIL